MRGMTFTRMTQEQAKNLSIAEQHEWFRQQRSRRAVLKGGVVGAGSLLVGGALLGRPATAEASTLTKPAATPAFRPTVLASSRPAATSHTEPTPPAT